MNYQKIYNKLPYFLKVVALNLKSYANYRKRFTGNYASYLSNYIKLWTADIDTVLEYQKTELINLLEESYQYSKWYRKKMNAFNITSEDIKKEPFEVLKKMPVLLKTERKKYVDDIINTNPARTVIGIDYTSGTSGSPTKNYLDKESIEKSFALWKRFHYSIGIKDKIKQIRFSGNQIVNVKRNKAPFWIYNFIEKQLFMSTYHLNNKNMKSYVKKLNKFKPKLLDGYPSAVYNLAKYINTNNISLDFKPVAICVTAETLYDYQREEIEKAFKCKVYNQYASSEGSPFITECKNGNLHLNLDSGIFELLNNDNKPAKQGEIAKLVVTSFRNLKTPLIRYDIGDNVLLPLNEKKCNCGCNMPVIEKIVGREDDLLLSKNGTLVGMMAYKVFKYAKNIKQGQIIQQSPDDVILNIEIEENFTTKDKLFIINKTKESLGQTINVTVNIVDKIPLGSNGKFITVKRNFKLNN